ncbi:ATP-sensitive inward rectifier potassium channel 10 [Trichoplax sp. H2]|nr:ATP-sensitive inward rectifier potassium channel 10 [Trichoplax sp. H2]|eukprot:RDD45603.1 ATP-sensitive inward rectifier potassium channel 10 [Trichoplax sp. H2]
MAILNHPSNQVYPQRRHRRQTWPSTKLQSRKNIHGNQGRCQLFKQRRQLLRNFRRQVVTTLCKNNYSPQSFSRSILNAIRALAHIIKEWLILLVRFMWNVICLNYAEIAEQADYGDKTNISSILSRRMKQVTYKNYRLNLGDDLYGNIIRLPFSYMFIVISTIYLGVSVVFAITYFLADVVDLELAYSPWYWLVYSLSVTTCLSSEGLDISRVHIGILLIANLQAFIAQLLLAFVTGIVFARFSRPSRLIQFSEKLIINSIDGTDYIQGRLTTIRPRLIVSDCQIKLFIVRPYQTREGENGVRTTELPLTNSILPTLDIMIKFSHQLNDESLLRQGLETPNEDFFLLAYFTGTDACSYNTMYELRHYRREDIKRNHQFVNMVSQLEAEDDAKKLTVDFVKLNQLVPLDQTKQELSKLQ